jgi:hypothetical protein
MFNIVKRRDFMLASDTATAQEAEQLLLARYGRDYIVVNRANIDPGQDQRITESSKPS